MPARTEDEPCIRLWDGHIVAPGSERGAQTTPEQIQVRYPGFRKGWEGDAAGERVVWNIHQPSITPFLPAQYSTKEPAAAILLIPGGGHSANCFDLEGTFIARWLAERGVAAFVLKYRLRNQFVDGAPDTPYELLHSVLDAERAMRLIRSRAAEWCIDPDRIGAAGFSAGGYPVGHIAMRSGEGNPSADDPIERISARPNFQVLVYTALTGSANGDPQALDAVPVPDAPPALLVCSNDDALATGMAELYLQFRKAGVSAEIHIYASGAHGYGLRPLRHGAQHRWAERMIEVNTHNSSRVCPLSKLAASLLGFYSPSLYRIL
jgi:acetyl esterase/lipase